MFYFLQCEVANDFTHYFNLDSLRGQILIATIILLGLIIAVGITLYFTKKSALKPFALSSVGVGVIYSLVVIGLFVAQDIKDGTFSQKYQIYLACGILAVMIGIMLITYLVSKKLNPQFMQTKTFKLSGLISLAVMAVTALSLIIVGIVKNNGSIEALTDQAQIYMFAGILIVLLSIVFFVTVIGRKPNENDVLALVYGAVCVALSFALSYVRIFKLPQGGSITIASLLPISIYSYIFGVRRGVLCCFIYGLLQAIQDPWIVHPLQFLLDYPLAFMTFGFVGAFKKLKPLPALLCGISMCLVVRYLCHMTSGAVFFGTYGGAYGINSAFAWGVIYNLFVFADGAILLAAAAMLFSSKPMLQLVKSIERKYIPRKIEDIKVEEIQEGNVSVEEVKFEDAKVQEVKIEEVKANNIENDIK